MKDHEIAQLVNKLTDAARTFSEHGSLRERIAKIVKEALKNETTNQDRL